MNKDLPIRVCTGFSPEGFELYGRKFLDGFHRHWPADIDLHIWSEEPIEMPRGSNHSILAALAQVKVALTDHPSVKGQEPRQGWRSKDVARGYCYRFDALKFSRMAMIPHLTYTEDPFEGFLVWLDGDVMTHTDVPRDLIPRLMGDDDVIYLGRTGSHSETGFVGFRVPAAQQLLRGYAEQYLKATVTQLPEWHAAFVFDHERKLQEARGLRGRSLTPNGRAHVWFQSELAMYTDHLKGIHRKELGYSPERGRHDRERGQT